MLFVVFLVFVCVFGFHFCAIFCSSAGQEESSPRVKPKFKQDTKFNDCNKNKGQADSITESQQKFSKPVMKFPKSKDKVNVWTRQKNVQVKKKEPVSCWIVPLVFCCGVSKEHQWYSLLGKGGCRKTKTTTNTLTNQNGRK